MTPTGSMHVTQCGESSISTEQTQGIIIHTLVLCHLNTYQNLLYFKAILLALDAVHKVSR